MGPYYSNRKSIVPGGLEDIDAAKYFLVGIQYISCDVRRINHPCSVSP